ncbi:hypothetical protein YC2023_010109 [Brassica napus]
MAEKASSGGVGLMEESMLLSLVLWVLYLGKNLNLLNLSNWLGTLFTFSLFAIEFSEESECAAWTLANGYALNHITISGVNGLEREREKGSPRACRRCRPAGSARRGRGRGRGRGLEFGLGLGSWWRASGPIRFFLDQVKLNDLPFNSGKNSMQFYLKRQVVCLENKNVMHFILSKLLNEIRDKKERVLGNKFRNSTSHDLREILVHMQQLLREFCDGTSPTPTSNSLTERPPPPHRFRIEANNPLWIHLKRTEVKFKDTDPNPVLIDLSQGARNQMDHMRPTMRL